MNAKRLTAYRVVTTLVLLVSALAGLSFPPKREGDVGGVLPPLRAAQASSPDLQAAIAAGYDHTCALKGGQVYCWGRNHYGAVGDNSTDRKSVG